MKDIRQTGFGWIAPNGETLGCDSFDHIESLRVWAVVRDRSPEAVEILDDLDEIKSDCQALEDEDGNCHGEWHIYEMACDEKHPQIARHLYRAGFIRIGTSKHIEAMEAEGRPESIRSRLSLIRSILRDYNAEHRCEFDLKIHTAS